MGCLVNEIDEFRRFTQFPVYKADNKRDTSYMGRFTFPMLYHKEPNHKKPRVMGFQYILTLLARGYLFREGSGGYDRIDVARRALLAWCSLPNEPIENAPEPNDPRHKVNYGEFAGEFPELVTPNGDGWLIRHVENIIAFVEANPAAVYKKVPAKVRELKEGFRDMWADQVKHMLIPPFASNTKAVWGLRFSDILADALELGPLQNSDFELSAEEYQQLAERTPEGVPLEVSKLLYKYYQVNKEKYGDYVLLPQQNFNAYFGNTNFSQKWVKVLAETLIEKPDASYGVSKYRMRF